MSKLRVRPWVLEGTAHEISEKSNQSLVLKQIYHCQEECHIIQIFNGILCTRNNMIIAGVFVENHVFIDFQSTLTTEWDLVWERWYDHWYYIRIWYSRKILKWLIPSRQWSRSGILCARTSGSRLLPSCSCSQVNILFFLSLDCSHMIHPDVLGRST